MDTYGPVGDDVPMLRIAYVSIESANPRQLAGFWGQLLNADVTTEGDEAWLKAETDHGDGYVGLLFVHNEEPRAAKQRIHLELAPDDYEAQLDRAISLGAHRVAPETSDEPWTVLTDPEGNEFLILQFH